MTVDSRFAGYTSPQPLLTHETPPVRTDPARRSNKHARLPRWAWLICLVGGATAYWAVGSFLLGQLFLPKLQDLFEDPGAFNTDNVQEVAPFVLLFIPAILGWLGTREMLRIVFDGRRDGHEPALILKNLGLYLLSTLALLVAAFFFGNKGRR